MSKQLKEGLGKRVCFPTQGSEGASDGRASTNTVGDSRTAISPARVEGGGEGGFNGEDRGP